MPPLRLPRTGAGVGVGAEGTREGGASVPGRSWTTVGVGVRLGGRRGRGGSVVLRNALPYPSGGSRARRLGRNDPPASPAARCGRVDESNPFTFSRRPFAAEPSPLGLVGEVRSGRRGLRLAPLPHAGGGRVEATFGPEERPRPTPTTPQGRPRRPRSRPSPTTAHPHARPIGSRPSPSLRRQRRR